MFAQTLLPWLTVALIAALLALIVWGGRWYVAKTKADANKSRLALFWSVATEHLYAGFVEIEKTMRPQLAGVIADGRVTPQEASQLKMALIEQTLKTMPAHIKAIGASLFGDMFRSVLGARIDDIATSNPSLTYVDMAKPTVGVVEKSKLFPTPPVLK